mmetsp:Transcript_13189/g.20900  ORF Transcript_13189/g.20900 Transcript_13189/m.20900 type:complete len:219 (+) Transcript_13189:260-916(+)
MLSIAVQRQSGRIDRSLCAQRVSLNARYLHKSANRITSESQRMFHSDLRRIGHLIRITAHHFTERSRCHARSDSDLTLTSHLGCTQTRCFLIQHSNGSRSQQHVADSTLTRRAMKSHIIFDDGGNHAGCAIGRCSDHSSTSRVLFVYRHGPAIQPIIIMRPSNGVQRISAVHVSVSVCGLDPSQFLVHIGGSSLGFRLQQTFGRHSFCNAFVHHSPNL